MRWANVHGARLVVFVVTDTPHRQLVQCLDWWGSGIRVWDRENSQGALGKPHVCLPIVVGQLSNNRQC